MAGLLSMSEECKCLIDIGGGCKEPVGKTVYSFAGSEYSI